MEESQLQISYTETKNHIRHKLHQQWKQQVDVDLTDEADNIGNVRI